MTTAITLMIRLMYLILAILSWRPPDRRHETLIPLDFWTVSRGDLFP
jgi:hypothetical protein